MKKVLNYIIAVIIGLVIGSIINGGIISLSSTYIPIAPGAGFTTAEAVELLTFKDYLGPFLAHALGTLSGAFTTAKIAKNKRLALALLVGLLFFCGGAYMVNILPEVPLAYDLIDLTFAYFPMAYLGYILARPKNNFGI